jgi:choline dehydrogenase
VLTRRRFLNLLGRATVGVSGLVSGCATLWRGTTAPDLEAADIRCAAPSRGTDFEYIVVGSGAGGGPLAANLARAGYRVLLLEAGGEDEPYDYQVPAFHPLASEDDALRWSFYVRHYADEGQQRRDPKLVGWRDGLERDGILYPRSGTLGGCTAHNAMILVYPHNSDWDHIAELTGDATWGSGHMRTYFERLERCQYVRGLASGTDDPSRHGFGGWLTTNVADPRLLIRDRSLVELVKATALESAASLIEKPGDLLSRLKVRIEGAFDPNDWRLVRRSFEGICVTPLTTARGRRAGSREYIRLVERQCPGSLVVRTHALATRVLLDDSRRAVGVEYLEGAHLYRADPRASASGPTGAPRRTVRASREVILAGGAFNTPQLLMLSGVGPRDELERHGIPVRVELPGVGSNLQDRYEVTVVNQMKQDFSILQGATFRAPAPGEAPDSQFREWLQGEGVYTTNGAITGMIKRSEPGRAEPDLYLFGLPGYFEGYYPGYSERIARDKNFFTWAVLKAHTRNTAGRVRLRSGDPRDMPDINFHYFGEGNDASGEDLESVVEGVELARRINARSADLVERELLPGPAVRSREDIRRYVRDNAWGHHASCTCKIGRPEDRMAVLDSRFRVYGTRGLRVVDASVFPRIPGFFIVSAVYMASEKASDVIRQDAEAPQPTTRT